MAGTSGAGAEAVDDVDSDDALGAVFAPMVGTSPNTCVLCALAWMKRAQSRQVVTLSDAASSSERRCSSDWMSVLATAYRVREGERSSVATVQMEGSVKPEARGR
jgi:hypothetical protein